MSMLQNVFIYLLERIKCFSVQEENIYYIM